VSLCGSSGEGDDLGGSVPGDLVFYGGGFVCECVMN